MSRSNLIQNLDLKNVPDEVLRAVHSAVSRELDERSLLVASAKDETYLFKARAKLLRLPTESRSFEALDAENWEYLFPHCDTEPKFYVYAHLVQSTRRKAIPNCELPLGLRALPFYIGKGSGGRAYDFDRNGGHRAFLRAHRRLGRDDKPEVVILRDGLTEAAALAWESKLVYFFGTKYEAERPGPLLNLDMPKRPEWCGVLPSRKDWREEQLASAQRMSFR